MFHWESDIWSTEFREGLFVFGPTKDQVSFGGRQHDRGNQRTKRNLIRLYSILH